jgi:hypothetical protein
MIEALRTLRAHILKDVVKGGPPERLGGHILALVDATIASLSAAPTRGWWRCADGHVFVPTEDNRQDGIDAPAFCEVEDYDGNPCLDSSHLIGPFASASEALADQRADRVRR